MGKRAADRKQPLQRGEHTKAMFGEAIFEKLGHTRVRNFANIPSCSCEVLSSIFHSVQNPLRVNKAERSESGDTPDSQSTGHQTVILLIFEIIKTIKTRDIRRKFQQVISSSNFVALKSLAKLYLTLSRPASHMYDLVCAATYINIQFSYLMYKKYLIIIKVYNYYIIQLLYYKIYIIMVLIISI